MTDRASRRHSEAHEERLMFILGLYHAGLNDGDIAHVIGYAPGRERQELDLPPQDHLPGVCRSCGEPVKGRSRYCFWCGSNGKGWMRYKVAQAVLPALSNAYPHTYEELKREAIKEWPWLKRDIERWEDQGRMKNRYQEPLVDPHLLRPPPGFQDS